jgi:PmbA protein
VEEILKKIISQAKGFHAEAVLEEGRGETLVFEKNDLLYPQSAKGESLTVRVTLPDGRAGVSSTSVPKNWRECVRRAKSFARVSAPDPQFKELPGKRVSKERVKLFDKLVESYDSQNLWKSVEQMIFFAEEKGVGVQMISAAKASGETFMMNSEGAYHSFKDHSVSGGVSVVKNGVSGSESLVFTKKPDFSKVIGEAVDKCLMSQKPESIKSCVLPLILEYDAFNTLSSILFNAVDGYSVFKDKSLFAGRQGERACSGKLTLTDNPLIDYGLKSCVYDGEGAPCKGKQLVVKGVVKSFLQDSYTTSVRGEGVNGNCASITSRPSISPSNLVVKGGAASYNKILNYSDRALLVKEVGGAHMVNTVSGDFSNEATKAFMVRKGVLTPVKKVMISGNYFELLNKLELVGNDSKQKDALVAPTLLFSEVQAVA